MPRVIGILPTHNYSHSNQAVDLATELGINDNIITSVLSAQTDAPHQFKSSLYSVNSSLLGSSCALLSGDS